MLAIPQSYSFQYLNETMPGAFPRNTKGIDRWGYYNGAVGNSMLFDATLFSYTPVMPAADREVHSIQSQGGLLSRMTYPTGGYTNFAYEPNLVPYNPSNPGMSNCPANHFVQTNASHNTNGTIDFVQNSGSFTIDSCNGNLTMPVTIDFGQVPVDSFNSPVKNLYSILSIYSETNGILVYKAPFLGYKNYYSTTIVLPPGTYNYTVTCDNNQTTTGHPVYTYARMTFYKKPVSGPPLNAVYGAGMRIKSITSYDNINNSVPALTRTYSYSLAQLLSIPTYGYSSVTHDWSFYQANGESGTCAWGEYIEKIYTSDYSSPIFSLINNQFYYPTVTEYSLIDTSKSGKTIYEFAGGYDATSIYLSKQTDYVNNTGAYTPVKKVVNSYQVSSLINFLGVTCSMGEVIDPDGSGNCINLLLKSQNQYDIVNRDRLYTTSMYTLNSLCNQLLSTDVTIYDQSNQTPKTDHTDYFYDNPDHLQPTRTVTGNSKNEDVITEYKYPADFNFENVTSLYSVDTEYISARNKASFDYWKNWDKRNKAADSVWNPSIQNSANTALINKVNSFHCSSDYRVASLATISTMNNGENVYYSGTGGYANNEERGIQILKKLNMHVVLETINSIKKSGTEYFVSAVKTGFTLNGSNTSAVMPATLYQTPFTNTSILKPTFMANRSAYYQPRISFRYNTFNNIIQQAKTSDIKNAYIWGYQNLYPVAQIINANADSVAYSSFEDTGHGNWVYTGSFVSDPTAPTGNSCYNLSQPAGNITKSIIAANIYKISYWTKNASAYIITGSQGVVVKGKTISGWTYYEHTVSGVSFVTVSGTGFIDELRLYPSSAQMITYTYEPMIGLTGQCDINNKAKYYSYDVLGRLILLKDQDRNILKKICYNTAGQPNRCDAGIFYNFADSATYYKNNCSAGYTGAGIKYRVPAYKYASTVSQTDANLQARNEIIANGQTYANTNDACIPIIYVTIVCNNYLSVSGFTVQYINPANSQVVGSYLIPSAGGLFTLPTGNYTVTFTKTGNTTPRYFGINCDAFFTNDTSATFYNINVANGSCNSVSLGVEP